MAAVGLGREEATKLLVDGVVIACENSPKSVTLSGDATKVEQVIQTLKMEQPDVFCRLLRVEMAYHSREYCKDSSLDNHSQLTMIQITCQILESNMKPGRDPTCAATHLLQSFILL